MAQRREELLDWVALALPVLRLRIAETRAAVARSRRKAKESDCVGG